MQQVVVEVMLRLSGISLIVLALSHLVMPGKLDWGEDLSKLKPINREIFIVHCVFLAVGIFLLGLVCLMFPLTLLERSALGQIASACFAMCWFSRLLCQIFVFRGAVSDNAKVNTFLYAAGTLLWIFYTAVFAMLFLVQMGYLDFS